jgi:hypothetical protein
MDNHLSYQRAEDKNGRNPVVNQYLYYPDGSLKEASGGGDYLPLRVYGKRPAKEQGVIWKNTAGLWL